MNSEQKCKAWRNSTPFYPQRLTTAYAAAYYSLCLPVFHCIYSRGELDLDLLHLVNRCRDRCHTSSARLCITSPQTIHPAHWPLFKKDGKWDSRMLFLSPSFSLTPAAAARFMMLAGRLWEEGESGACGGVKIPPTFSGGMQRFHGRPPEPLSFHNPPPVPVRINLQQPPETEREGIDSGGSGAEVWGAEEERLIIKHFTFWLPILGLLLSQYKDVKEFFFFFF